MRLSQYIEREPAKKRRKTKRTKPSVAEHGAFVPILAVWAGALVGLVVMVMPQELVERFGTLTGLGTMGGLLRIALASVAGLLSAVFGLIVARAIRSKVLDKDDNSIVSTFVERRVQPIDPSNDLGSDSLDAPLEDDIEAEFEEMSEDSWDDAWVEGDSTPAAKKEPTLGELSQRGYEFEAPEDVAEAASQKKGKGQDDEPAFTRSAFRSALIESCEGATCEASPAEEAAEPEMPAATPQVDELDKPVELDLAEFAEMPGRNAVWVEEQSAPKVAPEPAPAPPPASALEKLRQRPTDELSLVEMVERFAGALHEHQQSEQAHSQAAMPGRDAALAEALKALTLFTESGFDRASAVTTGSGLNQTEQELREALAKLQDLRGAA